MEEQRDTKPWDFLNPNVLYASKEDAVKRMDICRDCPFFIDVTGQCSKCSCFMKLKTKLLYSKCPDHKW